MIPPPPIAVSVGPEGPAEGEDVAVVAGSGASAEVARGLGLAPEALAADAPAAIRTPHDGTLRRTLVVPLPTRDEEGLRTAAAHAVRLGGPRGSVAWVFDPDFPVAPERHVHALAEGAVLAAYDAGRWKTERPSSAGRSFHIVGADASLAAAAARGAELAGWTNLARELVDTPPNLMRPVDLAERARALPGLVVEALSSDEAGTPALAAVGGGSSSPPLLVVLRHDPPGAPADVVLGLVGKGVTYDSGGYFLKPQSDIVRQKSDMAGAAAVVAAMGAIAAREVPLRVLGVVAAAENMIGGSAMRPSDVIATAGGLSVEVTNPDAEGRLILADALWWTREQGATHVVDLATLTGAMRAAVGDVWGGVFASDDAWRQLVVDAGNASGDPAWPWPMSARYEPLLESSVADLKNTSGKPFGYPITAATFLRRFAGDGPWAHVDMIGPAFLDDDRGDAFGRGATGYGVRMLVELAERLA